MPTQATTPADTTPEQENRYHTYVGSQIPWFLHLMWILFWGYVITYFLVWLIPAILTDPVLTKPR
jgi:hypothetical protein